MPSARSVKRLRLRRQSERWSEIFVRPSRALHRDQQRLAALDPSRRAQQDLQVRCGSPLLPVSSGTMARRDALRTPVPAAPLLIEHPARPQDPPQPGSGLGLRLSDPDAAADDRHPHLLSAYSDRERDAWLIVCVEDSCREVVLTA
ncbi:hypothetical protein VTN00DRAFT_4860 [Thermoascus crustaceus]|uniref:uncharacterized protein n=1 Tax=Thermoascus crustaceus TaxID=5088 RepID=UPI0037438EA4